MSSLEATGPISVRIAFARLAERAIAADPGVGPVGDARWVTRDGDRKIAGVVTAADGAGRVDVDLHLVAFLPPRPLERQAEELRAAVLAAARGAGLAAGLGKVDVAIHDLVEPGEGTA